MRGTIIGLLMLAIVCTHGFAQEDVRSESDAVTTTESAKLDTSQSRAQSAEGMEYSEPYVIRAGVQLGIIGAGISTENAERRKSNPDFWFLPTYGAVLTAPIGKGSRIAGRLDLGVWTTGTRTRPYANYDAKRNWDGYFAERYTYFTVAPYINLNGIIAGVGFSFPMKGAWWNPNYDVDAHVIDRSTMKIGMDFRLGGSIPAWDTELGTLYVELLGYYMFSGVYVDGKYPYGLRATDDNGSVPTNQNQLRNETIKNLIPAGGQLGISYQFKLGL